MARIATAAAVVVSFALHPASPAEAGGPKVEITKVYYSSPGTDTGSNWSLNHEWVRLTNRRTYTINLKGWTLRDRANHVYPFRTDVRLGAGRSPFVHTGAGPDTTSHRYWDRHWYVWSNNGDKAYLRNVSGSLIDSCSWDGGGSYTWCR